MVAPTILKIACLTLVVTLCRGQGQDSTKIPGTFGAEIVNTVVGRIRSRCVFSEDRLFLRRTAYVMSRDGRNSDTYRTGFDGGIWQVSESTFQSTQNCNSSYIKAACNNITASFNIHWPSVTWSDLRKPLYSGLAAALATRLSLGRGQMAGNITSQATLWAQIYGFPEQKFITDAALTPAFDCKDPLDLVFILDSSGSVSRADYRLMLAFAADVVDVMDVSVDGVRVADVVYSSSVGVHFDFDDFNTTADVKAEFLKTPKYNRGTNTARGLSMAQSILYNTSRGARHNVKKVAVLVTDGQSSSLSSTTTAATYLKDNGTTVFAVGVGNYRLEELQAVASEPKCSHVLTLTSFDHITSILTEIQKSTCEANYKFTEEKVIHQNITEEESEHTAETIVPDTTTKEITAEVTCGILNIFVSATDPKPGPAVFDNFYHASPGAPAVLTSVATLSEGTPVYVTVVGTRLPQSLAALFNCSDFSWTLAVTDKKNVTVICEEDGVRRPCTAADITKTGLCPENVDYSYPVQNPCTTTNLENGVLRHPYPYDPTKFLQCDMKGDYYVTQCPGGVFFNTATRECGFTSPGQSTTQDGEPQESNDVPTSQEAPPLTPLPSIFSSPCTVQNISKNKFYHTYSQDKTKFVQCDKWGQAWVMTCSPGTQWSQSSYTCVHVPVSTTAAPTTVCTHGQFLVDPCDHHKYYICSHGALLSMSCPVSLFFDASNNVCTFENTNTAPIPAHCATQSG